MANSISIVELNNFDNKIYRILNTNFSEIFYEILLL